MTAAALVALAVVGVAVGFLAGLIGIGGGVFTVPFLYFFYSHESFSGVHLTPALHATVAHATSLFIIVPTAAVGTATYARSRLVEWRAAVPVAAVAIVGASVGALIASRVPAAGLKVGFGIFLVASGLQLLVGRRRVRSGGGPLRITLSAVVGTGLIMGVFSALLGVGGGLIGIPLLLYVLRVQLERVAATSLAIIAIAAAAGTVTYVATGQSGTAMQLGPLGYVHLAVALPMLPGAVLAVRWGARLNQRLDPNLLRWTFAAVFVLVGLWIVVTNVGIIR